MHYYEILLFSLRRRGRKGGRRGKVGGREKEGRGKEEEGKKGLEKQPANMLCQKMFLG